MPLLITDTLKNLHLFMMHVIKSYFLSTKTNWDACHFLLAKEMNQFVTTQVVEWEGMGG